MQRSERRFRMLSDGVMGRNLRYGGSGEAGGGKKKSKPDTMEMRVEELEQRLKRLEQVVLSIAFQCLPLIKVEELAREGIKYVVGKYPEKSIKFLGELPKKSRKILLKNCPELKDKLKGGK